MSRVTYRVSIRLLRGVPNILLFDFSIALASREVLKVAEKIFIKLLIDLEEHVLKVGH